MPRLLSSLLVLTFAAPMLAQGVQRTSIQTNQPPSGAVTTLHTGTRLIVVDVVVTDKNQNPVHYLKASDFALLENNTPQDFKSFEEHTALSAANAAKIEPMPTLPAGVFTNFTAAPTNGPLNILLLDRLNTPVEDQARVQQQVTEYLKNAKPGTRMAIFGLTSKLILLQGFTDNPEILKAILNRKGSLKASALIDDSVGGNGVQEKSSDKMDDLYQNDPSPEMAEAIAYMQLFEAQTASYQLQLRAKYTLDAMNELARYLAGFPGRKNLIWFSGSFPINILPSIDHNSPAAVASAPVVDTSLLNDPFVAVASDEKEFRETTALLSRAQVAVYPIYAPGLVTAPAYKATTTNTGRAVRKGPAAMIEDNNNFSQQTFDEHATMYEMADQTGGHAFANTNGLTQAVDSAIETGANYYTIAYSPTDTNWNGTFRSIQVKLQQQGLNLSYRRGYFCDDPDALPKADAASGTATSGASNAMRLALTHGGPAATQITFVAKIHPASTTSEDAVAPGNNVSKTLKGPFRRYSIDISVDPRAMAFTDTPQGTHLDTIEFDSFLYDIDGKLINTASATVSANLKYPLAEIAMHGGIPFHQQISTPDKGEYFLRIGVHDIQGDRVGAVEIPISSVRKLPPAIASASAPASAPK